MMLTHHVYPHGYYCESLNGFITYQGDNFIMYLGTIQGNNNGNGRVTLTADNLKFACAELGIQDDSHTLRRAARAFDLYHSGKVEHVNDHTFVVASQYDRQRPYQVTLHPPLPLPRGEGATKMYGYCTCQDWMNYSGDMDVPNVDFWCKHMISAALWLHNNGNGNGNGNLTSIKNECRLDLTKEVDLGMSNQDKECGTDEAKAIQAKLNGQIDSLGNNGNGAKQAPSQPQLDISDPFQECESYDIDQVEGRRDGEMAWKLRNGEYVISYQGVMTMAQKHGQRPNRCKFIP